MEKELKSPDVALTEKSEMIYTYTRALYLLVGARQREIQEVGKQHFLLPKIDSYYILTLQLFATLTSSVPSIDFISVKEQYHEKDPLF
jgi:hypothetical protein